MSERGYKIKKDDIFLHKVTDRLKEGDQLLVSLCDMWVECKTAESQYALDRKMIEDAIVALSSESSDVDINATGIHRVGDVEFTTGVTYYVDDDALSEEIATNEVIKRCVDKVIRFKPAVNVRGFKSLQEEELLEFSKVITSAPSRPSFKLNTKKENE